MRLLRLAVLAVLLTGCTAGSTGSIPAPERYEAVRVSLGISAEGRMLEPTSVYFTLEEVTPPPATAETIGSITVEDAAGRTLATVEVPRPSPVSIIDDGEAAGEVAFPDSTSVVVPWPPEADHVRAGGGTYAPAPPSELSPPGMAGGVAPSGGGAVDVLPARQPIHQSGDPEERFDFVIVGDGYGAANHGQFVADAQRFTSLLLATEPYTTFADRINVWAVPTQLPASGSALACHFNCQGIDRLLCCDEGATLALAKTAVPSTESVMVLRNAPSTYGGAGGRIATSYNGPQMPPVLLHELGHTFDLRDEYVYAGADASVYSATEAGVNCALSEPPHWDHWLDEPGVGAFAGCRFPSAFRPTDSSCLMREVGPGGYCPVCREHVTLRIYAALGRLITSTTPEASTDEPIEIGDMPTRFELETQAVGEPTYAWNFDHEVATEDAESIEIAACSVLGRSRLTVTVTDHSDFVRRDPRRFMSDSASWPLAADPAAATDGCLPMCLGDSCDLGNPCCDASVTCYPTSAGATSGSCCAIADAHCGGAGDCCGDMACVEGRCQCQPLGASCVSHSECCGGAFCNAGTCAFE